MFHGLDVLIVFFGYKDTTNFAHTQIKVHFFEKKAIYRDY